MLVCWNDIFVLVSCASQGSLEQLEKNFRDIVPAASVASKKKEELKPHVEEAEKSMATMVAFLNKFRIMLIEGNAVEVDDEVPDVFVETYLDIVQEASWHHDAGKKLMGKLKALMS
jgi:hypothetical protein